MYFSVLGFNFNSSPIEVREKFAINHKIEQVYEFILNLEGIHEALVLNTCNRVELYFISDYSDIRQILDNLPKHYGVHKEVQKYFYSYNDKDALVHMCEVGTGIDSAVLGEEQIFSQLREAFIEANLYNTNFKHFIKIRDFIFKIVKKVKRQTILSLKSVSVSSVAISKIADFFDNKLSDKTIYIIGLGKIGKLAVQYAMNKDFKHIMISNRTKREIVGITSNPNIEQIEFNEFSKSLPLADIVLVATGLTSYLIDKETIKSTLNKRLGKETLFIDLAMPRNIEAVEDVDKFKLYNIDFIKDTIGSNFDSRKNSVEQAKKIILEGIEKQDKYKPLHSFASYLNSIKTKELDKMPDDKEKEVVEKVLNSYIKKVLYEPSKNIKKDKNLLDNIWLSE